jgi:hypothetical protein
VQNELYQERYESLLFTTHVREREFCRTLADQRNESEELLMKAQSLANDSASKADSQTLVRKVTHTDLQEEVVEIIAVKP